MTDFPRRCSESFSQLVDVASASEIVKHATDEEKNIGFRIMLGMRFGVFKQTKAPFGVIEV
jgi:hypothetical protein